MRKPVTAKIRQEAEEWAKPWSHDKLLEQSIRNAFLGGAKFALQELEEAGDSVLATKPSKSL